MSDKKTTSNATFEQEFEKFLRDEATQVGSTYRKLPSAEPDAQLDARVRTLAQRALLDGREKAAHRSRPAWRWVPAFASAAVLVLATGIVWRLGPHNWAGQKDAATTGAAASKTPSSSMPAPAEPAAAGSQNRSAENEASSTGPVASAATSAQDGRDSPEPFPSPRLKSSPPSASADATTPGSGHGDDTNAAVLRNDALSVATNARTAALPTLAREKSTAAESRFAQGELKKSEAAPPLASAAATPAQQRALALETTAQPSQNVAAPALQGAPAQMRQSAPTAASGGSLAAAVPQETAKPAPAQPARSEESTPMPVPLPTDRQDVARGQQEYDERGNRRPSAAPGVVERSLDTGQTLAKSASAPPPPPSPPASISSPSGYPSKPIADAAAAPAQSASAAAVRSPQANVMQGFADRSSAADAPNFRITFRPTAAQLAAWPAPNCHSPGTVKGESRSWSYPPEVPGTWQLRFVTVKNYLDEESREAALKAYSDFRHCYPDDHWPVLLLQRLGAQ